MDEQYAANIPTMSYVQREESKPDLGDFTLGEYTEKVILYGFLMVSLKPKLITETDTHFLHKL